MPKIPVYLILPLLTALLLASMLLIVLLKNFLTDCQLATF